MRQSPIGVAVVMLLLLEVDVVVVVLVRVVRRGRGVHYAAGGGAP